MPGSEPDYGEGGWHLDVEIQGARFSLFIHWAEIGEPSVDSWVIQPGKQTGIVRRLFGRKPSATEFAPICELLHDIVDHNPDFTSVRWVTTEEFKTLC